MRIAKSRDCSHDCKRPTLVGLDFHFHNLLQPAATMADAGMFLACHFRTVF